MKMAIGCELILMSLCIGGCGDKQGASYYQLPGAPVESEYYIDSFYEARGLSLIKEELSVNNGRVFLCVKIEGERTSNYATQKIRESIGDYGGKYIRVDPINKAVCDHFLRLDVSSGQTFNGVSPGGSLGRIVSLFGATAYPELINKVGGYKSQELDGYSKNDPPFWWQSEDYFWYHKKLDELSEDDLFLLDPVLLLCFDEMPEDKEQTLTVTLTDTDGKKLSVTGTFIFPENSEKPQE